MRIGSPATSLSKRCFPKRKHGARVTWGLHRDARSRKPAEAFRELATSYVQTGLAVDRHGAGNGAMKILPFSLLHQRGAMDDFSPKDASSTAEKEWQDAGVNLDNLIDVAMSMGSVALWTPYIDPLGRHQYHLGQRTTALHQRLREGAALRPRRMDVSKRTTRAARSEQSGPRSIGCDQGEDGSLLSRPRRSRRQGQRLSVADRDEI